jgi:cytochrome c oxidase subunit 2
VLLHIRATHYPRQAKSLVARGWRLLCLGLAMVVAGCVEAPASRDTASMLDVHGQGARLIRQEWWLLFGLGTAIVLLITGLLGAILVRQFLASRTLTPTLHERGGVRWIWLGGIALPVIVLLIVFGFEVRTISALASPPSGQTTTILVEGHRWWWEVQYPEQGFTTANQLVIPVGQAVRLDLTSADVIHSFWAPQLHFKRDLLSGQTNSTWLQADEPGVYRGVCAEFCGLQHAQMRFTVIALTPERYGAWLAHEAEPAAPPEAEPARTGQQIFLSASCVYCHTVRGTPAAGEVGPDLTHFASRLTIAAGALENNVGNLGGWILDPQHIKPGTLMPPTPLTGEELQALLAYLSTLQ